MEQKSRETKQQQDYLEIEAPEYLESGQNFYNQEPFRSILAGISERAGVEIDLLRKALSSMARQVSTGRGFSPEELNQKLDNPYFFVGDQYTAGGPVYVSLSDLKISPETKRNLLAEIGGAVKKYPFWYQYVFTQSTQEYKANGSKKKIGGNIKRTAPETYAFWVSKKLLLGIKEIFPQDFAPESQVVVPKKPKERNATRKWRILRAAELVSERKS